MINADIAIATGGQTLYELANENSELTKIEEEVKSLKELLVESIDFNGIISSPMVSKEDKKNILTKIADKNNFSKTLKNFLGFMAIKNRLFFLDKIIESFLSLVSNNKGELEAKLISSKKLSIEEQKKIQEELTKDFKSSVKINYKYDPNLIAGLTIQVGSIMVDTSIKTKLKKIEKIMIEA